MSELTKDAEKAIEKAVNSRLLRYAGFFGLLNILVIIAAAYSFMTAFDNEWKESVDKQVKNEFGENLEVYSNLIGSNAESIQEQLNYERDKLGETKARINNLGSVVDETTENANKLRNQVLSSDNDELKQLFELIQNGNSDNFFEFKEDINLLQTSISKTITQCRICIASNNGGQCYPRNQNDCSEWASLNSDEIQWSNWFKDDTDDDGGSCSYKWGIQCK